MRFSWWGETLEAFDHPYNDTIHNERAVEIAVALRWLNGQTPDLEVGNVLGHYGVTGHRVVDLHEQADGVENVSVLTIDGSYRRIVAISTLEHVGWDDRPRDDSMAAEALDHLRSMLAPCGRMLVTIPMGYHQPLDAHLLSGAGAARACTIVRHGKGWRQSKALQAKPYGATTPWAESVWIGEFEEAK